MEYFRGYCIEPIERLGQGGFGYVEKINLYNASGGLCGAYARKVLSPCKEVSEDVAWEEIRRRFIREVSYQSRCANKHVMPVYIFDKDSENPYFIMGLAEGDLQAILGNSALDDDKKISVARMWAVSITKCNTRTVS